MKVNNVLRATVFLLLIVLALSCDGIFNPSVSITDCVSDEDITVYSKFITNEKEAVAILKAYDFLPGGIPDSIKSAEIKKLSKLNVAHDSLRQLFNCSYWSTNSSYLDPLIGDNASAGDKGILDPEKFRSYFKVKDKKVIDAIGQAEWQGKDVYVFPGVSRIPWEGSSESNRQQTIKEINKSFNKARAKNGLSDDVELFNSSLDYLYPHANFHQIFILKFSAVALNTRDTSAATLYNAMLETEKNVVEKLIIPAPETLKK